MAAAATPGAELDRRWETVAEGQAGVLGRRQALLGGLSEDQWQWRLDRRRWRSVLPGVVATHSGEVTELQRAWAAVLYAGPGACLTGDAALAVHGMRTLPVGALQVAVPERRTVRPQVLVLPDCQAVAVEPRRVRDLERWRHPVRRPPSVRLALAVLHAASAAASDRAAEWRIAAAVQQRLVLPHELRRALDELPRLPRRPLVRTVLDDVELGAHAAGELDFLRFLRRHRLPPPDELQRPVRAGRLRYLDAWWQRQRVAVEVDGAHHRSVAEWEADALRSNDVVLSSRHERVVLLRFTSGNLRHDADRVAAQLAAVLL